MTLNDLIGRLIEYYKETAPPGLSGTFIQSIMETPVNEINPDSKINVTELLNMRNVYWFYLIQAAVFPNSPPSCTPEVLKERLETLLKSYKGSREPYLYRDYKASAMPLVHLLGAVILPTKYMDVNKVDFCSGYAAGPVWEELFKYAEGVDLTHFAEGYFHYISRDTYPTHEREKDMEALRNLPVNCDASELAKALSEMSRSSFDTKQLATFRAVLVETVKKGNKATKVEACFFRFSHMWSTSYGPALLNALPDIEKNPGGVLDWIDRLARTGTFSPKAESPETIRTTFKVVLSDPGLFKAVFKYPLRFLILRRALMDANHPESNLTQDPYVNMIITSTTLEELRQKASGPATQASLAAKLNFLHRSRKLHGTGVPTPDDDTPAAPNAIGAVQFGPRGPLIDYISSMYTTPNDHPRKAQPQPPAPSESTLRNPSAMSSAARHHSQAAQAAENTPAVQTSAAAMSSYDLLKKVAANQTEAEIVGEFFRQYEATGHHSTIPLEKITLDFIIGQANSTGNDKGFFSTAAISAKTREILHSMGVQNVKPPITKENVIKDYQARSEAQQSTQPSPGKH